jgi:alpha-beta hydrolase superfamily lysophospholipase
MRGALIGLLLLLLAACAPVVMPAGPVTRAPEASEDALLMADGARLRLRRFAPEAAPRAVLLALHGFNDHGGNFLADSIGALNAAGLLVYAYDQRGFGASPNRGYWPGAETLTADAAEAAVLLRARHPGLPFFLLGESMGAAVAILASARAAPPPVDGYVLLTPALLPREAMGGLLRGWLWLTAHTMPAMILEGGISGVVASDNPEALRRLGRDPLVLRTTRVDAAFGLIGMMNEAAAALPGCCRGALGVPVPALLLVGARDRIVPQRASRAALRDLPDESTIRLAAYRDGFHLLLADRNRAVVARDILAFLADPRAPLPSRADGDAAAWREGRPLSPAP